jgi:hypothetical protein
MGDLDDMSVLWWLQSNLGDPFPWIHGARAIGDNFAAIPRVPFSDRIPEFEWQGPVIFYGATRMTVMLADRQSKGLIPFNPLVWYNHEEFRYSSCVKHWGR